MERSSHEVRRVTVFYGDDINERIELKFFGEPSPENYRGLELPTVTRHGRPEDTLGHTYGEAERPSAALIRYASNLLALATLMAQDGL